MTAAFSNLLKHALITFQKANIAQLQSNFLVLKKLVDQLTIKDINLDENLVSKEEFNTPGKAPCTFVHIFENEDVSMSVFIIQSGYTMPCHDHPMMNGLLKVLSGTLLVRSFTKKNENEGGTCDKTSKEVKVLVEPECTLNNKTESAILTPVKKNFHEITALNGVAAFFDILSPPYDSDMPIYGKRKCNFYRRYTDDSNLSLPNSQEITLERIPAPKSYYCDRGNYIKPDFLLEYEDTYCESD